MTRVDRRFFMRQSVAIGAALLARPVRAKSINERLNIGFIGTGGRGTQLLRIFKSLDDVRIAALCDVDEERLNKTASKYHGARKYGDLRKLLNDRDVDAVVIATCNHWHALAAIWAMQAGKDVYVEKPLSHNHWEGQQVVKAARKYERIVQLGTQQRSDPMQAEIKDFLHNRKELGEIKYVQVCRFGPRASIGKRSTPLKVPKTVNYDLWLGPARDQPIYRDKLHYDWHWDWNTGNGELGNYCIHVLDDAVNVVLRDQCPFPESVSAAGGRVVWNDAGETPNVCFSYYDSGSVPLLLALSNVTNGSKSNRLKVRDVDTGYLVQCDGGYYEGTRGKGSAHDLDGRQIRTFNGDEGAGHQRNFVEAVFARNRKRLNAEVVIGHQSTAWCNLSDAARRSGDTYSHDKAIAIRNDCKPWHSLVDLMEQHLARNSVEPSKANFQLGPALEFDAETQRFKGAAAETANHYLHRQYRRGFEVPEIA